MTAEREEPRPALYLVHVISLVATILGAAGLALLLLVLLRRPQETTVWQGFLMLCATLVAFLVGTLLSRRWLGVHDRLAEITEGLDDRVLVPGALGVVTQVRGRVDGVACRVTRDAIEVEVPSAVRAALTPDLLRAIAAGTPHASVPPGIAARPAARAAAAELIAAGRVTVRLEPTKAILEGASSSHEVTKLVRALVAFARSPALFQGKTSGAGCPYCKDAIHPKEAEGTVRCASCDTVHHTPCWNEHGGCAVYGCVKAPGEERAGVRARS